MTRPPGTALITVCLIKEFCLTSIHINFKVFCQHPNPLKTSKQKNKQINISRRLIVYNTNFKILFWKQVTMFAMYSS